MSKNVIPLEKAKHWTKNWRTKCPDNCKAFLVPSIDLINVLEEMGVIEQTGKGEYTLKDIDGTYARFYMGIDPETKEGNGEKLLIVGTKLGDDGVYRDLVPERRDAKIALREDQGSVYDFSRPCPNECDTESPLFS